MNIYKRQMEELKLNTEQYSKLIGIPTEITKKIINGKEVVEDMKINEFLRKSMINKHQEIENDKENVQMKAIEIRQELQENKIDENNKKVIKLKNIHPNDKILDWYLYEFNVDEYFKKYRVKGKIDLMRRYHFYTTAGRCEGEISSNTIDRVIYKKFDKASVDSIYEVAKQLYDCFVNGNIKDEPIYEIKKEINHKKNAKKHDKYSDEEKEIMDWYINFDFKKLFIDNNISNSEFTKKLNIGTSTGFSFVSKKYNPSIDMIEKAKDFINERVSEEEQKLYEKEQEETLTENIEIPDEEIETLDLESDNEKVEVTNVNDETIITKPIFDSYNNFDNYEKNLLIEILKERLTEEEKYLITLFGGKI